MNFRQEIRRLLGKPRIKPSYGHFLESVYHLRYYQNVLELMRVSLDGHLRSMKLDEAQDSVTLGLRMSVQWVTFLIECSIEDEMSKFLFAFSDGTPEQKTKVKAYKKITAPVRNELKKWRHIRKFRNHVLAHNLRDSDNKFHSVFKGSRLDEYVIPNHVVELLILIKALKSILQPVAEIFSKELSEAEEILNKISLPTSSKSIEDSIGSWNIAIQRMNQEIERYNSTLSSKRGY